MARGARYRTFTAVGYPESLAENWLQILEESHIPILVSPLHDQDVNEDGEIKKPHYHFMIDYAGPHLPEDAKQIFDSIGAVMDRDKHGNLDHVNDKRGMARYFCHLDTKDERKAVYDIWDVTCLNGFDYHATINLSADRYSTVSEMIDFVNQHDIKSFADLVLYSKENNESWYRSLCDNSSYFMDKFIKSRTWTSIALAKLNKSQNLSFANNSETDSKDIV